MASAEERLTKFREERALKEKARIEKLRQINLQKYGKLTNPATNQASSTSSNQTLKPVKNNTTSITKQKSTYIPLKPNENTTQKFVEPIKNGEKNTKDICKKENLIQKVPACTQNSVKRANVIQKIPVYNNTQNVKKDNLTQHSKQSMNPNKVIPKLTIDKGNQNKQVSTQKISSNASSKVNQVTNSKTSAVLQKNGSKPCLARKSMLPMMQNQESVFDRLYKPKPIVKPERDDVQKLKTDPNYLKKVMNEAGMIVNKRHTFMDVKDKASRPVRRSISAVHFKRISKSEMRNCIHKWASISDKMDKVDLQNVSEDNAVKEDKLVIAVKSERKKVKFQTPCHNFNTPRPQELQARLKSWLQRRGKALDSYHHLQCFGLNHLQVKPLNLEVTNSDEKVISDGVKVMSDSDKVISDDGDKVMSFNGDDENKENIALESDSDNESYTENMNGTADIKNSPLKQDTPLLSSGWRHASLISESVELNDTVNTTLTSGDVANNTDEVLLGALNDLTDLLKEGFEWEQCARWLRAIRERFPHAPNTAAYWECRAQLEERRGDLPASVQCWEEAIVKGTQHSVVEASLDQLLDKFMQLKISPNSGKRQIDPKMVDVKNVFKSTIIRFAVQQAKIRQSEGPKFTVTPVRRSARLSAHWSGKRTPLQVCTSVRQAGESFGQKLLFVPNETLAGTP